MKKITCECGHVNPEGTVLCEACGKPMNSKDYYAKDSSEKVLNMRYEGSARRSQTYNTKLVDKIWNFFSSVKVGVWLIAITLIASSIGTIFPQEMNNQSALPANQYYEENYGLPGKIFYQLGFHDLYGSWWYMLLVASIAISLVIASLDRFVPLYRALKKQKPQRNENFIKRQRLFGKAENAAEDKDKIVQKLKDNRYKISEKDDHILAEKGRFSRWGPYVNHIGLIIFLIGALLRFIPAMYIDEQLWVREGQTNAIPGTDRQYYIKNEDFFIETYEEDDPRYQDAIQKMGETVVSNYQTNAVLYERVNQSLPGVEPELKKVKEGSIQVNKPLKIDGFGLYQTTYQLDEFKSITFKIHRKDDSKEEALDTFTVDLLDPKTEYNLEEGFKVVLKNYFPEFKMDDGEPTSYSKYPRNPAFVFHIFTPESPDKPEVSFVGIGANLDPKGDNEYKVGLTGVETRDVTGLTITRDLTLPILSLGGLIFMIGVIQGMYWNHRRIWIHPREKGFWIAAHTNKNWYGMKRDIQKVVDGTQVPMLIDQSEQKN